MRYEQTFYDGVIVRRAQGRAALAEGIKTDGIGSPLTKVQRRALAAQLRAQGKPITRKGGSWTKHVNDTSTLDNIDPVVLAASKRAHKIRKAALALPHSTHYPF